MTFSRATHRIPVVVLDTNLLQSDWMMQGLAMRVLRFMSWHDYLTVVIPAVVVEEIVANHERNKRAAVSTLKRMNIERRRDGLPVVQSVQEPVDYRAFLGEFLSEAVSGWSVADWPSISHADMTGWSLAGEPPFDATDRGYRDALVWETARELAEQGGRVILASNDHDFAEGRSGRLASNLRALSDASAGEVTLASSLGDWLLANFPWEAGSLRDAADVALDMEIDDFLMQSDFLYSLNPRVEDLDLPAVALDPVIETVDWLGPLTRVGAKKGPDGSLLVEYDMPVDLEIRSVMSEAAAADIGWRVLSGYDGTSAIVEGTVQATARLVVFGDGDDHYVEEVYFRQGGAGPDPGQPTLFESTTTE